MASRRRPGLTQRLFRIHGWLGLNLGLILFIVCASGTVATLGDEIDWLIHPEMRVEPAEERLSWGTLLERVQEAYPGQAATNIQAPEGPRTSARFQLLLPRSDSWEYPSRIVHVDPYRGTILGETNPLFSVQHLFRLFHKQLFIYGPGVPHGTLVVGFFALTLLLSAVTGILFYRTWFRRLFTLRRSSDRDLSEDRKFWSDLHRLVGVWGLAFSVVIAATGLWYFADELGSRTGIGGLQERGVVGTRVDVAEAPVDPGPIDLDALLERTREEIPDFELAAALLPAFPSQSLTLLGDAGPLQGTFARAAVLDPWSSELIGIRKIEDTSAWLQASSAVNPLHFGDFGGLWTRWLWFVFGVALSGGIIAGARIWHLRTLRLSGGGAGWVDRLFGVGLTAVILLAAVVFTVRGVENRIAPTGIEYAGVGSTDVGPWQAEILRQRGPEADPRRWTIRVHGKDGGAALYTESRLILASGDTIGVPMTLSGAEITLPGPQALFDAELEVVDGRGATHSAGLSGLADGGAPVPPTIGLDGLRPRPAVAVVALLFVAGTLVVIAWWLLLFRDRSASARERTGPRTQPRGTKERNRLGFSTST